MQDNECYILKFYCYNGINEMVKGGNMNEQKNNKWLIILTFIVFGGAVLFCMDGYKRFQFSQDLDVLEIEANHFGNNENQAIQLDLDEDKEQQMIDYLSKHVFIKSKIKTWNQIEGKEKVVMLSIIVKEGDEQGNRYRLQVVDGQKEVGITSLDEVGTKEEFYELVEKDWENFQDVFFTYFRDAKIQTTSLSE